MTETTVRPPEPGPDPDGGSLASAVPGQDRAQLGLAALLAVVGAYTLYDASTLRVGFADPVGPKVFPYAIGAAAVVLAALMVLSTLRGERGEVEGGEDVDLGQAFDWATVLRLCAVIVFVILTVEWLGWAISGGVLFTGAAWSLGSRTLVRDVITGFVLSVASWYAFYSGLGVPLSPGVLDGIL